MAERSYELLSNEELGAVLSAQVAKLAADVAAYFEMVREVDRRPGFVPGARAGVEARTYLRAIGVDDPGGDVRIARALDEVPQLAGALAAGEVTRGQVKVAEQALRAIRAAVSLDDATLVRVDATLTGAARDHTPAEFRRIAGHLVAVMTHDAGDVLDEREVERRKLVLWKESGGWTGIEGYLPPDIAAPLWAAMDRWARPHPAHPASTAEPSTAEPSTAEATADGPAEAGAAGAGAAGAGAAGAGVAGAGVAGAGGWFRADEAGVARVGEGAAVDGSGAEAADAVAAEPDAAGVGVGAGKLVDCRCMTGVRRGSGRPMRSASPCASRWARTRAMTWTGRTW
jgi:hypothetical protein